MMVQGILVLFLIVGSVTVGGQQTSSSAPTEPDLNLFQQFLVGDCTICTPYNLKYCCLHPRKTDGCCGKPKECTEDSCSSSFPLLDQLKIPARACFSGVACLTKFPFNLCCMKIATSTSAPSNSTTTQKSSLLTTKDSSSDEEQIFPRRKSSLGSPVLTTSSVPTFPTTIPGTSTTLKPSTTPKPQDPLFEGPEGANASCGFILAYRTHSIIPGSPEDKNMTRIDVQSNFDCSINLTGTCPNSLCNPSEFPVRVAACSSNRGCMSFGAEVTVCCMEHFSSNSTTPVSSSSHSSTT